MKKRRIVYYRSYINGKSFLRILYPFPEFDHKDENLEKSLKNIELPDQELYFEARKFILSLKKVIHIKYLSLLKLDNQYFLSFFTLYNNELIDAIKRIAKRLDLDCFYYYNKQAIVLEEVDKKISEISKNYII